MQHREMADTALSGSLLVQRSGVFREPSTTTVGATTGWRTIVVPQCVILHSLRSGFLTSAAETGASICGSQDFHCDSWSTAMKEISGKVAFVTGAANGIELGICRALARAGAKVALADIQPDALERARQEFNTLGGDSIALSLDVSVATQWHARLMK